MLNNTNSSRNVMFEQKSSHDLTAEENESDPECCREKSAAAYEPPPALTKTKTYVNQYLRKTTTSDEPVVIT